MYKSLLLACLVACIGSTATSQNKGHLLLSSGRFTTGTDPSWSKPGLIDTGWKTIRLGQVWQSQGFQDYHGFAWYRIHVNIPSTLKQNAGWKDSLRIFLAHVNDVDETFLNGTRIGKIGMFPDDPGGYVSKWPAVRQYHIPVSSPLILWDADNIIAIKVYDGGGSGGIFMGTPYIDMLEKIDGISFESAGESLQYLKDKAVKTLHIGNGFNTSVEGTLNYKVYDAVEKKLLEDKTEKVKLPPFARRNYKVAMPHKMGIEVSVAFTETLSGEKKSTSEILPYLLTPPAKDKPQVNGPGVFGVRPGSPFFYRIPATGKKPIEYEVKNLPAGLKLNAATGIISGTLANTGEYKMLLVARNAIGRSERPFTVKAGDLLALTPPMGWNSWNCWGLSVSDEKVKSSARALVDKGLMDHGWMYMNIDDGWEAAVRASDSTIQTNEKFPDMKGLGDYLHAQGIRFGIYSSPGPRTCGGYLGSYKNEEADARSYASWGVDYLKYDLCSYTDFIPRRNATIADEQKPYIIMRDALRRQSRDIVYSLCQYGRQNVPAWGREVNGNLWRTTGDIEDTWNSLYRIGFSQSRYSEYAGPGGWNDPDMLIVGMVGWGENLHPTRLTPYEQYTHMSLWSLLSAPLLLGCDLSRLDPFTLNLLTNDEVIAIDQDALGKAARLVITKDSVQVWVKELQDGSKAVGIFNLNDHFREAELKWSDIGLQGNLHVRNVWIQKDLGIKKEVYTETIPPHGVVLVRVNAAKQ